MTNPKKINFIPIGNVSDKIFLDALVDDHLGLTLYFRFDKMKNGIKVFFDSYLCYRNSDESERFNSINQNTLKLSEGSIFKTKSSAFLDWIIEESQGVRSGDDIYHYLFVTPNDIIDIISWEDPIIEKFNNSEKTYLNFE